MLTEARLGRPLNDALTDMAERLGSKNFDFVITAVTSSSRSAAASPG